MGVILVTNMEAGRENRSYRQMRALQEVSPHREE